MKLKKFLVTLFLSAAPLWLGLLLYRQLPDQIPCHWNLSWEVDRTMAKTDMMLGMSGFMVIVQAILCFVVKNDPKYKNMSTFMISMSWWFVPAMSLVITPIIYFTAMGMTLPIDRIIPAALSLVFMVIGNYMPKTHQNYTIGIKIPWTLNDEQNWDATHRFAGHLWFWCSLAAVILSLLGLGTLCIAIFLAMAVLPIGYSYLYYRNHKEEK